MKLKTAVYTAEYIVAMMIIFAVIILGSMFIKSNIEMTKSPFKRQAVIIDCIRDNKTTTDEMKTCIDIGFLRHPIEEKE